MMKQASPISIYLNTGMNRAKSAKSYASSTSGRKKNIEPKITLKKMPESSSQNKEATRKRASSKSIAIPKSPNNMLWFDEASDHTINDKKITFAHTKAITRNVKNQLNGKLIQNHQQQKATQLQSPPQQNTSTNANDIVVSKNNNSDSCQSNPPNPNPSNSNTSQMYIERWASARRSSSDDSRSRSNSVNASPPQRTPPRVTHRSINTSDQLLMSGSPNGTRKRRGSKTSSEMRVDNFKRQHMTEQQEIENQSYGGESITGTSNIDEWGWFVEVPFSPEKSSLSIRNSMNRKQKFEDHVKALAVSNKEEKESGKSEDHVLRSPILSLLSKQVEEVHKNNKKKNNGSNMNNYMPTPTVLTNNNNNSNTVANVNNTSSTTIGKSNSLLKLWEGVSISKVPSAEQALNTIGSSAIDYLETSNPTLNHVSSFCFEMDL